MDTFRILDNDILARLESPEDSLVEMKSFGDTKDLLKTCVAFANSCAVDGPPGILCYGTRDDGTIQDPRKILASYEKTLRDKLSAIYPGIKYDIRVISKDGRSLLAVIVPGSATGPHFAGPAYVRQGASSVIASEELFSRIVDKRERKVREILRWKGERILMRRYVTNPGPIQQRNPWAFSDARVVDCTAEWLQLEIGGGPFSFPLDDVKVLGCSPQPPYLFQIEVPQ
jgi:Putative DNA-binding domain